MSPLRRLLLPMLKQLGFEYRHSNWYMESRISGYP